MSHANTKKTSCKLSACLCKNITKGCCKPNSFPSSILVMHNQSLQWQGQYKEGHFPCKWCNQEKWHKIASIIALNTCNPTHITLIINDIFVCALIFWILLHPSSSVPCAADLFSIPILPLPALKSSIPLVRWIEYIFQPIGFDVFQGLAIKHDLPLR